MNQSIVALLGYTIWMMLVLLSIGGLRSFLTLTGQRTANSFAPDGADVSPFSNRLCRAHANLYESFPMFGGLLLLAIATGQTEVTDPLAFVALGARLIQTTTHLVSTSVPAVLLRFTAFAVQVAIFLWWAIQLLLRFTG